MLLTSKKTESLRLRVNTQEFVHFAYSLSQRKSLTRKSTTLYNHKPPNTPPLNGIETNLVSAF